MRNIKAEHDEYVVQHKEHQDVIPVMGIIVIFGYPQVHYSFKWRAYSNPISSPVYHLSLMMSFSPWRTVRYTM